MDQSEAARPAGPTTRRGSSSPLALPLGGFGAVVFAVLVALLRVEPHAEGARRAARPADFPEIYGKDVSLEGLPVAPVGSAADMRLVTAGPTLNKDTFPCSQCHDNKDLKTNPEVRKLRDPHDELPKFEGHGSLWCLDCHDANDRDHLKLANGTLVDLSNPVALCAQCHGLYYREWQSGVHGKRTGYWNGPKRVLRCDNCHNPHSPHFRPLTPLPPPVNPAVLRPEGEGHAAAPKTPATKEEGHHDGH